MENKEPTFTDSLFGIIPIINFRGVSVEKIIEGYRILGQKVKTTYEVNQIINQYLKNLEKSIVNPNMGELIG